MGADHNTEPVDMVELINSWSVQRVIDEPVGATVLIKVLGEHVKYLQGKVERGNAYSNAGSGKRRGW